MATFPIPDLFDRFGRRRAEISSPFGAVRLVRDVSGQVVTDSDGRAKTRTHQGADLTFARAGKSPADAGSDSPDDPSDDDSPNEMGAGFARYFVPPRWPVLATEAGEVVASSVIETGGRVRILHELSSIDGANGSAYFHLDDLRVKVGDRVREGQQIGIVGAGKGRRHLHFEREVGTSHRGTGRGKPIDPAPYLERARQLPRFSNQIASAVSTIAGILFGRWISKRERTS